MRLAELVAGLRAALGIGAKREIQVVAEQLRHSARGPWGEGAVRLGDDCAAIPDGDGFLLFAAEGMWPAFVESEPWFAGYSALLVNVSDVCAMGGRPIAAVDALWSTNERAAQPLIAGMRAAAERLALPIVGGHVNLHSPYAALAVAVLGRARRLITSFDARAGDDLIAAVDLRGEMHPKHAFWNASAGGPAERLRADLELLPALAEAGLCAAGKDISMGGLVGSALMLLESSGAGGVIELDAVPRPPGVELLRWLLAFPSFGYVLAVAPRHTDTVLERFARRSIACARIGRVEPGDRVELVLGQERAAFWDFAAEPLTGFGARRA
jgi:uncharacterized protein